MEMILLDCQKEEWLQLTSGAEKLEGGGNQERGEKREGQGI